MADENGKEVTLRRYDHKTIVLTLPQDLTVFDIGHFGIWCEAFTVDFGHVTVPSVLNVPPSLKMLGVLPQVSFFFFCSAYSIPIYYRNACPFFLHLHHLLFRIRRQLICYLCNRFPFTASSVKIIAASLPP